MNQCLHPGASLRIRNLLSEFPGIQKAEGSGHGEHTAVGYVYIVLPTGHIQMPSAFILLPERSPGPLAVRAGYGEGKLPEETLDALIPGGEYESGGHF